MLKTLFISDFVLIEKMEISFKEGFNVISGETGSGKSIIMRALGQVLGDRSDLALVRSGFFKATAQALFAADNPAIGDILRESGIECEEGEDLIVKKDIFADGKSRVFINNQPASSRLLRKIGGHLLQIVGQHAKNSLFDAGAHLEILDIYAALDRERQAFGALFERGKRLRTELNDLRAKQDSRLEEIEAAEAQLREIEAADIKEGEEEELFQKYCQINNLEELRRLSWEVDNALGGEGSSILSSISGQSRNLERLALLDPKLREYLTMCQEAEVTLREVAYALSAYRSRLENGAENLEEIDERLKTYNRLRKKYGPEVADIIGHKNSLSVKIERLKKADQRVEDVAQQVAVINEELDHRAEDLSARRKAAGKEFAAEIGAELRTLNMEGAQFFVSVTQKERTIIGDDLVEFYFRPNIGEEAVPVKRAASGGELSRIMLAKACVMCGKEPVSTMVFDEIDANVGGRTAAIMGEKLRILGKSRQVISITHFPQLADHGVQHIKIFKREDAGRTIARAQILDASAREEELARMMGR